MEAIKGDPFPQLWSAPRSCQSVCECVSGHVRVCVWETHLLCVCVPTEPSNESKWVTSSYQSPTYCTAILWLRVWVCVLLEARMKSNIKLQTSPTHFHPLNNASTLNPFPPFIPIPLHCPAKLPLQYTHAGMCTFIYISIAPQRTIFLSVLHVIVRRLPSSTIKMNYSSV